ncbi:MAG TPA: hypothetical protein VI874_01145 [Candidatus Norongarragalinales archaeon]|nr:hypothetical protein [Candidatus Norongarragalinales archaeon]
MKRLKKTVVYDFNGTLVPAITKQGMAWYRHELKKAMGPLLEINSKALEELAAKKGIRLNGKNLQKKLANLVLDVLSKPKRGTPAREVYYDLQEIAFERGIIPSKALWDAASPKSTLIRERKQGYRLVGLSRGTQTLLDKLLLFSGLSEKVERIFTTHEAGGEKTAQAYAHVYAGFKRKRYLPVRFYEDEFDNVEQLFLFGLSIAKKKYPFQVIWVDRKKQLEKVAGRIENLKEKYGVRKHQPAFNRSFIRVENLLAGKSGPSKNP